ncbi:lipopolysaccharide biosynthesis protein [Frankia gtarii]|uniref:lipopolysaccharide biosynthesis protein n=1 Tax=Frankia gtarii TaxID=2950102 RepID=UPI0021BF72F9|nr:hypothetical protein [Frankia gtarii]
MTGILRSPLLRNAILLMASTAITGVLGIAFWAIAAWKYSPENVGRASTAVSTMLLLSGLAQLNQQNILPATISAAAKPRRKIIRDAYALSGLLATVLALGFVALFGRSTFLGDFSPWFSVFFVAAVAFWCVFTLQDSVLAGLRKAPWVPIENAFFAGAKLVLLFAFATLGISAGLFYAWTAPVFLLVIVINALIWRRVLPGKGFPDRTGPLPVVVPAAAGSRRRADWYIIGDMAGGLVQLAATTLLPVIVSARLGYEATAYFYTSWNLVSVFDQLMGGATASLTVEGTRDSSRVSAHILSMVKFLLAFIVPVALLTAIFSGTLLGVFGSEYSHEGTNLLACLAVGAIFRATILLAVSISRVQRKAWLLLAIQGSVSACLLTTALIVGSHGLTAIGLAYLGCHVVIALAVVPIYVKALRRPSPASDPARAGLREPAPSRGRPVLPLPYADVPELDLVVSEQPDPYFSDPDPYLHDPETTWLIERRPSLPDPRQSGPRPPASPARSAGPAAPSAREHVADPARAGGELDTSRSSSELSGPAGRRDHRLASPHSDHHMRTVL